MTHDQQMMNRCLQLAEKGAGNVLSNPMVGCVIEKEGQIIAEGFHQKFGDAHAEVNAIQSLKNTDLVSGACAYVNLEPCAHQGKTPPCAHFLVEMGLNRVVIGSADPNPLVAGKGIDLLNNADIQVETGCLENESRWLNRRFYTFHEKKRPHIVLKWAQSSDGFIGGNGDDRNLISDQYSGQLVHKWRSEEMGILIGRSTAQKDNPLLTVRKWSGRNPTRIVIDPTLALTQDLEMFGAAGRTIIFTYSDRQFKTNSDTTFAKMNRGKPLLHQIMRFLYDEQILSVLVEGGAFTLNSFINEGLWDEARVLTSPVILKNGVAAPKPTGCLKNRRKLVNDYLDIYLP